MYVNYYLKEYELQELCQCKNQRFELKNDAPLSKNHRV